MPHIPAQTTFPYCPAAPAWRVDWEQLQQHFSWIQAMRHVPQSPIHHAEGDVYTHTRMVAEALCALEAWRTTPEAQRPLLFASALLHDVGKPACTQIAPDGQISSRGHARKGEQLTRRLLWTGEDSGVRLAFPQREAIAGLVRWHGLPLQFLDRPQPERTIMEVSQSIRMDQLALLAEADVRGRRCTNQQELLTRIELFREFCQELACFDAPRAFSSAYSRFVYFHSEQRDPDYAAYDTTTFEVVVLAGLPGVGKDTWIQHHLPDWPVITLDAIRRELHIAPEETQGAVVQLARERARVLMRAHKSFVWNATNITRRLRQQLIDFFVGYGARVRLVYLETPFETLLTRNRERHERVPETVIYKLLDKLEPPTPVEAHQVEYITDPDAFTP